MHHSQPAGMMQAFPNILSTFPRSQRSGWAHIGGSFCLHLNWAGVGGQVRPSCISAHPRCWPFSVGSTGVHCCHLTVLLNSLWVVGSHQFLKSWLILILDRPFSLCIWIEHSVCPSHGHQVILSCTANSLSGCSCRSKVGSEKPPPGMLSSDTLPTKPSVSMPGRNKCSAWFSDFSVCQCRNEPIHR